jgi:hypothetical protein
MLLSLSFRVLSIFSSFCPVYNGLPLTLQTAAVGSLYTNYFTAVNSTGYSSTQLHIYVRQRMKMPESAATVGVEGLELKLEAHSQPPSNPILPGEGCLHALA